MLYFLFLKKGKFSLKFIIAYLCHSTFQNLQQRQDIKKNWSFEDVNNHEVGTFFNVWLIERLTKNQISFKNTSKYQV